jgi:pimeloyl-ACP methyl ester carboxylesterase
MMARLLRWLLLVQLALAALLFGVASRIWPNVPASQLLAASVAAVLAARLALNANNFLLSWYFRSPTPPEFRLGPGERLWLFANEFVSSMVFSSWTMVRARPGRRLFAQSPAAPVLLLHGWGANSGFWAHLVPKLDAARISHARLDLEPMHVSIDQYLPMVAEAAEALLRDSGARQLVLVGHSMGGIVARAYLRTQGGARVARVITLGSPHHGSELAHFAPGRNMRQMRTARATNSQGDAGWLAALAQSEEGANRALVTSIFSHHDNMVAPQTSSLLPGAKNIAFGGIGHVAMGWHPAILGCVMDEIKNAGGEGGQL